MQLSGRTTAGIAVAGLIVIVLSGCQGDSGGSGGGGWTLPPVESTVGAANTTGPVAPPAAKGLPTALVGTWSGDDSQGVGSWTVQFAGDGRYRMSNERRKVVVSGVAVVDGARLTMRPQSGQPVSVTWSVSGGRLILDGSVYLRADDAGSTARALVGTWLSTSDTYKTLTFAGNGTFVLDNPAGDRASGTYAVSGTQVTLRATGRPDTTFGWSISNGFLTLRRADGTVSEYTRAG